MVYSWEKNVKYKIFYANEPFKVSDIDSLTKTHTFVGTRIANDLEHALNIMHSVDHVILLNEKDKPVNFTQRIYDLGLSHTFATIGDVIQEVETGRYYQIAIL
jgi:hypothetical protein